MSDIESRLLKMRERAMEFAQARSAFQIEKFIGCDEHTPITRFRHLSHNSFATLKAVKQTVLEREKLDRLLKKLEKKSKSSIRKLKLLFKDDHLDIDIIRLKEQIEDFDVQIKGGLKEVEVFESLCDALEKQNNGPFTYAQLEAEEPERWHKQLSAQAYQSMLARTVGVNEGNVVAMLNASSTPILSGSINVSKAFDFNPAILAQAAETSIGSKLLH